MIAPFFIFKVFPKKFGSFDIDSLSESFVEETALLAPKKSESYEFLSYNIK